MWNNEMDQYNNIASRSSWNSQMHQRVREYQISDEDHDTDPLSWDKISATHFEHDCIAHQICTHFKECCKNSFFPGSFSSNLPKLFIWINTFLLQKFEFFHLLRILMFTWMLHQGDCLLIYEDLSSWTGSYQEKSNACPARRPCIFAYYLELP